MTTELAENYTVEMTMGKNWPTKISHRGKVFPIDASRRDILEQTSGVLVFGKVGNGQGLFRQIEQNYLLIHEHTFQFKMYVNFREENGRVPLKIFVEFLRPVIKEEREREDTNATSPGELFAEAIRAEYNSLLRSRSRNCREKHDPPSQSTSAGESGASRRQRAVSPTRNSDSDDVEDNESLTMNLIHEYLSL